MPRAVMKFMNKTLLYAGLMLMSALMLLPFLWMVSASLKLNKDVFTFPVVWIPENPDGKIIRIIWNQNTLADVCHEYGKNYGDCHFPAGIHLKLCSVCVRKTALYWQGSHFPRLYCDYRIAVASLHGASVCADEQITSGEYAHVNYYAAGVFCLWRISDAAVLCRDSGRIV